jgi:SAM-dependent methyltransferase
VTDDAHLPEHVRRNRACWDAQAADYVAAGERAWAWTEPTWGIWRVPESQLGVLPRDLAGKDAIELGCGTAYVSAWLAQRGARAGGIDGSAAQLATARRLQREYGRLSPARQCRGGSLSHTSFGLASPRRRLPATDPQRWVPEAARCSSLEAS